MLVPATDIPGGIGRFAALMDPQGAAFNIFKGLTCGVTLAQAPQPPVRPEGNRRMNGVGRDPFVLRLSKDEQGG